MANATASFTADTWLRKKLEKLRRQAKDVRIHNRLSALLWLDQGWALVDVTDHETDTTPLRVERYEVADLATAERRVVHLAGDVVLDAPGLELAELESAPNSWPAGLGG